MKRIIKVAIPLILLGYLVYSIAKDWNIISPLVLNLNLIPLFLSFTVAIFIYPEGALCWQKILKRLDHNFTFASVFQVWITSHTGRYIPGTIWQYLGRVELAKSKLKLERLITVLSTIIEIFLLLVAASLIGSWSLYYGNFGSFGITRLVFLSPLLLVFLHPKFANQIIKILSKISKKEIGKSIRNLSLSDVLSVLPYFLINFCLNGIALFLLAYSFGAINFSLLPAFIAFYAFSWLLGYVTLIAPAGVGITETSLAFLLSAVIPFSVSSLIVILYRVLLTVAEMLSFGVALGIKKNE